MSPNIEALRAESIRIRQEAYEAANQLFDDVMQQAPGVVFYERWSGGETGPHAASLASDARAATYTNADRDYHDRNAAIDRLANAPQHPVGNPDSNEALRFLASMEVEQPQPEPAPRNRMENGPRGTFTGTAAEFLELKRLGTLTPEDAAALARP